VDLPAGCLRFCFEEVPVVLGGVCAAGGCVPAGGGKRGVQGGRKRDWNSPGVKGGPVDRGDWGSVVGADFRGDVLETSTITFMPRFTRSGGGGTTIGRRVPPRWPRDARPPLPAGRPRRARKGAAGRTGAALAVAVEPREAGARPREARRAEERRQAMFLYGESVIIQVPAHSARESICL
jgi:hypothetical protein